MANDKDKLVRDQWRQPAAIVSDLLLLLANVFGREPMRPCVLEDKRLAFSPTKVMIVTTQTRKQ